MSYTCRVCWLTSHHPRDAQEKWCAYCERFEDEASVSWPRPRYWRLEGRRPLPCRNTAEWAAWFGENGGRRLIRMDNGKAVGVMTVFSGVDRLAAAGPPFPPHPPRVFETVVLSNQTGSAFDQYARTYASWAEAELGHVHVLERLRGDGLR